MRTLLLFIIIIQSAAVSSAQRMDSLKVYADKNWVWHKVLVFDKDTIEGKSIAVYAADTSITAYEKNYYLGYVTGVYRSYYPDGKLMEKIIYQKGMKNGEYELRNRQGEVLIKGEYKNDIMHGYWSDRRCMSFGKYKNGFRHGKWKWFYEDRSYLVFIYKKGKLIKSGGEMPECMKQELLSE